MTFGCCLGWLHLPPGRPLSRGVVICPSWGPEMPVAYRGLAELAARCAAAGLPVLRFDYPGTGDSGGEEDPARIAAFRQAIVQAVECLAAATGVQHVALCGLRLGALLAAEAAPHCGGRVDALALLEPVGSVMAFRREMLLLRAASATPGEAAPGWIELAGERLWHEEAAASDRQGLGAAIALAGARRVLVLARRRPPAMPPGVEVAPFQEADAFLAPPHLSRVPQADFVRLATWLAKDSPPGASAAPPQAAVLDHGHVVESALRFGPGRAFAGVVARPQGGGSSTAVLLLNTGMAPRAGSGRFGTRLARHLAALGVPSLRMDLCGIGDSAAVPGQADPAAPPDIYRGGVVGEAMIGVDMLMSLGATSCLVVGICAGAHAALQLARRDPRVGGIALFNLPAFDRAAGGAPALDGGPPPGERPWLRRPRMLMRRLMAEAEIAAASLGVSLGLDRPNAWMRDFAARGVQVLLAYSERDRGLRELRAHFGRGGRRLIGQPLVRCRVLDGTDHSLTPPGMQQQAMHLIAEEVLALEARLLGRREARRDALAAIPQSSLRGEAAGLASYAMRVRP